MRGRSARGTPEDLDHPLARSAAGHHDDDVGIGLLKMACWSIAFAGAERPLTARTALGHRVEQSMARTPVIITREGAASRCSSARPASVSFLHHRHVVVPAPSASVAWRWCRHLRQLLRRDALTV